MVPYILLVRCGYPTRIPIDQLLLKFDNYLPKFMKLSKPKLCEHLHLAIGYRMVDFKLGETQVFYLPGKNLFDELELSKSKDIVWKIDEQITHDNWNSIVEEIEVRESKMKLRFITIEIRNALNNSSIPQPDNNQDMTRSKFLYFFLHQRECCVYNHADLIKWNYN